MENTKLDLMKEEIQNLAVEHYLADKTYLCPEALKLELAARLFLINPVYIHYIKLHTNDDLHEYLNMEDIVSVYCKTKLEDSKALNMEFWNLVHKSFDHALIALYSKMINDWWQAGVENCDAYISDNGLDEEGL